jgi:hypothetical protein
MAEVTGIQFPSLNLHGYTKSVTAIPIGGGIRQITHNYCDPCTWWQESTEHTDQATTSGDQLTYDITGHTNLIDLRHGRAVFEESITTSTVVPNGNTMTNIVPTVSVDAVALDQSNEDATSGDDRYTIDYDAGTVTFAVARGGAEAVTVSFRKSGNSDFTIVPDAGKRITLEDVEVDCTENIDMTTSVVTTVYGSHTTLTGGAIVPVEVRKYKVFHDFHAAARKFWGPVPSGFGGTGGVSSPKWTFQWEYIRSDELYATANYVDQNLDPASITVNKIVVTTGDHLALGGDLLTLAFYGSQAGEADQ